MKLYLFNGGSPQAWKPMHSFQVEATQWHTAAKKGIKEFCRINKGARIKDIIFKVSLLGKKIEQVEQ